MANTDRVAVITGAGSGIGRATALRLAKAGYSLVLAGRRRAPAEETAALARAPWNECVECDVGKLADVRRLIARAAERGGRLDVLVNNAGLAPLLPIDKTTPEVIDEAFRVNALGPAWAIHLAWPLFQRQRGGCIVNVSTIGTVDPFPGFFAYAAAKASVNLMAASCAKEGKEIGVRAFAVAPGAVEAPMLRALFGPSDIPQSQTLSPDAVAAVIEDCIAGRRDADNGKVITLSVGPG